MTLLAAIMQSPIVLIFLGGGAGAVLRYGVSLLYKNLGWTASFPWHTFSINVIGSFALGILAATCRDKPTWMFLLGVGLCGGFTTFSTFSVELLNLLEQKRPAAAAAYAFGSVLATFAGAWLGMRLAGR